MVSQRAFKQKNVVGTWYVDHVDGGRYSVNEKSLFSFILDTLILYVLDKYFRLYIHLYIQNT